MREGGGVGVSSPLRLRRHAFRVVKRRPLFSDSVVKDHMRLCHWRSEGFGVLARGVEVGASEFLRDRKSYRVALRRDRFRGCFAIASEYTQIGLEGKGNGWWSTAEWVMVYGESFEGYR